MRSTLKNSTRVRNFSLPLTVLTIGQKLDITSALIILTYLKASIQAYWVFLKSNLRGVSRSKSTLLKEPWMISTTRSLTRSTQNTNYRTIEVTKQDNLKLKNVKVPMLCRAYSRYSMTIIRSIVSVWVELFIFVDLKECKTAKISILSMNFCYFKILCY